tara:strand:- start:386 stop:907 length:522 start_codon:yes stop_codon:yes gene_type:complete
MSTQQNVSIEDVDYKLIECIVYNNNGITTNNIVTIYNNNSNKTIDGIKYVITNNIVEKVIEMLTNFPCSFQNFAEYFKENNKWFIKINDIEKFNKYKKQGLDRSSVNVEINNLYDEVEYLRSVNNSLRETMKKIEVENKLLKAKNKKLQKMFNLSNEVHIPEEYQNLAAKFGF